MRRFVNPEELMIRMQSGDRSFLGWLRGPERRRKLAEERDSGAGGLRFLAAYFQKVLLGSAPMLKIANFGVGLGAHARSFATSRRDNFRFVGFDHDPSCLQACRRQYGGLTEFQFHPCDYLKPPKLPRPFDYILVTEVLNRIPNYRDLLGPLWGFTNQGMLLLFNEPMNNREHDHIVLDSDEQAIRVELSASSFSEYASQMAPQFEFRTIYSDNSLTREHVVLLKKQPDTPTLSSLHKFSDPNTTFPFSETGLI